MELTKISIALLTLVLLISGCKSEEPMPKTSSATIDVNHTVDNAIIASGKVNYQNTANNQYSITRLEYYLSNFRFIQENGEVTRYDQVFYINAFDSTSFRLFFDNLPPARYTSLVYNFGLIPKQNISNSLSNTNANANMFWPEMMGGGYHFMKLEGRYKDSIALTGYAIHLGTNVCTLQLSSQIDASTLNKPIHLDLTMDVNEWFTNPKDYDFITDGRYTMGDTTLMTHITDNGQTVFTLK